MFPVELSQATLTAIETPFGKESINGIKPLSEDALLHILDLAQAFQSSNTKTALKDAEICYKLGFYESIRSMPPTHPSIRIFMIHLVRLYQNTSRARLATKIQAHYSSLFTSC